MPQAPQLLEQPLAAIDYGETDSEANQNYEWASEKKFPHYTTKLGSLWLLVAFCTLSFLGYSVSIYPCQALTVLGQLRFFLCPSFLPSFLLGFFHELPLSLRIS